MPIKNPYFFKNVQYSILSYSQFKFVVLEVLFGRLGTAIVNIHNSRAFPVFSSKSLAVVRDLSGNSHRCWELFACVAYV